MDNLASNAMRSVLTGVCYQTTPSATGRCLQRQQHLHQLPYVLHVMDAQSDDTFVNPCPEIDRDCMHIKQSMEIGMASVITYLHFDLIAFESYQRVKARSVVTRDAG